MEDGQSAIEIGGATDAELPAFAKLVQQALNFPSLDELQWIAREQRDGLRVARVNGAVAGTLGLCDFQQQVAGAAVPMGGVRCVAVAPEHRGRGVATALMRDALAECRRRGYPVSVLYPSTQPVYRRAGYEQAGTRVIWAVPLAHTGAGRCPPDVTVRRGTDDDVAWARRTHDAAGRTRNGNLHRRAWTWERLLQPLAGGVPDLYVLERAGERAGYALLRNEDAGGSHYHLQLLDHELPDAACRRALWWFLSQHRSMALEVRFAGGFDEPLLAALPSPKATVVRHMHWLMRIVDWPAAIAARGWATGLHAEVAVTIDDDWLPDNAGDWTLRVADGRATAERGGAGGSRLSARALGPLYTGYATPASLRAAGLLQASDAACAELQSLFAAGAPVLREMF